MRVNAMVISIFSISGTMNQAVVTLGLLLTLNVVLFAQNDAGNAIQLDGDENYVEVPDHPSLNPTGAITVEAWVFSISYQGILTDSDGEAVADGSYKLTFRLYAGENNGSPLWQEVNDDISVENGIFSVILGSGNSLTLPFNELYYLGLSVGDDAELSPRIELTASAYSLNARSVADSAVTGDKIAYGQVVRALRLLAVDGSSIATLTDSVKLRAGSNISFDVDGLTDEVIISAAGENRGSDGWSLTGNAGTDTLVNFLGTTDDQALELRVNNQRALRLEPTSEAPNIIAGDSGNSVDAGVQGGTISGGGKGLSSSSLRNRVTADHGIVGGGKNNMASSSTSTIGGGSANNATSGFTTVGGGIANTASGNTSTIGGGSANDATAFNATVGGGQLNAASGVSSTVPGGSTNIARGDFSLAAGKFARANHRGAFVWSDPTGNAVADSFSSTAENQFLINAAGGVGIGTNIPASRLHIEGGTDVTPAGGGFMAVGAINSKNIAIDNNEIMARDNGSTATLSLNFEDGRIILGGTSVGSVGIGFTNPTEKLHVNGNALADAHTTPSSRRWKTNIRTIENSLEKVQCLRGVTYDWKASGKHDIGLIAEEVGEVIPEIVTYEENGIDAKSVDYPRLVAVLIEAAKEQLVLIDRQNKELCHSQNELQKLVARDNELEKQPHRSSLVQN